MYSVFHKPLGLPCSFEYFVQMLPMKMSPIYLVFFGLISLPKWFCFYEIKVLPVEWITACWIHTVLYELHFNQ